MPRPKPKWIENARSMRSQGMTYQNIREVLLSQGFDANTGSLHYFCKDIEVPKPVADGGDWRDIVYPEQTWTENKHIDRKTVY